MIRAPDALLRDLFADLLPPDRLEQAASTLAHTERMTDLAALRAVQSVLSRLAPLPEGAVALAARLCRICDTLQAIRRVGQGAVEHLAVRIDDADLFKLVEQCTIGPAPELPAIVLVGGPHRWSQADRVTVTFPGKSWAEQSTEIVYSADPRILWVNSSLEMFQKSYERLYKTTAPQRSGADYDLDLRTNRERRVGTLQTRELRPPYTLRGGGLEICFGVDSSVSLLETCLLQHSGKLIGQTVRVIPPVS